MDGLIALLLGLIQGVAEWLPISSEGWLYIVSVLLLGIDPEEALASALFLHLGSSIAAILVLRKEIRAVFVGLKREEGRELGVFLSTATAVTCVVGFPLYIYLRGSLLPSSGRIFALATGFLLLFVGFALRLAISRKTKEASLTPRSAIFVGLLQGLSVIPGISRSGITLAALILLGFGKYSLKLSFLLGIPVILGASLLQITSVGINMLPAFFSSFITSLLLLRVLLSFSYRVEPWKLSILFGFIAIAFSFPLVIS